MSLKKFFQKYQNFIFYFLLFVIIFIGLYLRIKPIFIRPITFDEGYTLFRIINRSGIYEMIIADPSVPPLQYLLVRFVSKLSTNIIYCRFISIFFSFSSSLLIIFWLKKFSKWLLLLVTLFMSFSVIQIYYAWEAYVYSQLFFLSLVSIYTFYIAINTDDRNKKILHLTAFILSSLCAFFTHYSFLWTIFAELFIVLITSLQKIYQKKRLDLLVVKCMFFLLITLSFYLPIFFKIFERGLMNISWMDKPTPFHFGLIAKQIFGMHDLSSDVKSTEIVILGLLTLFIILISFFLSTNKKIKIFKDQEKNIILYNLVILLSNLFIPFFLSFFLESSVYAARTIIISSFCITLIISFLLIALIRIHVFNIILVATFCFLVVRTDIKNNQTQKIVIHRTDTFKEYVDVLRTKQDSNYNKILFLDFLLKDSSYKEGVLESSIFDNYSVVFDYYWFGCEDQQKLPNYTLITKYNFSLYKNSKFWGIIVAADDNIDSDVGKICTNITEKYEFDEYEKVYLFRCN